MYITCWNCHLVRWLSTRMMAMDTMQPEITMNDLHCCSRVRTFILISSNGFTRMVLPWTSLTKQQRNNSNVRRMSESHLHIYRQMAPHAWWCCHGCHMRRTTMTVLQCDFLVSERSSRYRPMALQRAVEGFEDVFGVDHQSQRSTHCIYMTLTKKDFEMKNVKKSKSCANATLTRR